MFRVGKLAVWSTIVISLILTSAARAQPAPENKAEPKSFWPELCDDEKDDDEEGSCSHDRTIVVLPDGIAGYIVNDLQPSFVPGSGGAAAITQPDRQIE